jgi:hypothetical protein
MQSFVKLPIVIDGSANPFWINTVRFGDDSDCVTSSLVIAEIETIPAA